MKFCLLRSGSSGNCTLIEHQTTHVLLDAGGVSKRSLQAILAELGKRIESLSGLVVTHTHSDHVAPPALRLCKALGIPVWTHENNVGIIRAICDRGGIMGVRIQPFTDAHFCIGALSFRPFSVSHDAAGITSGFVFHPADTPANFVTYAADLGCFEPHLLDFFRGARAIVLESNHDIDLLWNNPNRHFVNKRRVAGDRGHLSNAQAAKALVDIFQASPTPPKHVVLAHLSGDHNTPELALKAVGDLMAEHGHRPALFAAARDRRSPFFEI